MQRVTSQPTLVSTGQNCIPVNFGTYDMEVALADVRRLLGSSGANVQDLQTATGTSNVVMSNPQSLSLIPAPRRSRIRGPEGGVLKGRVAIIAFLGGVPLEMVLQDT